MILFNQSHCSILSSPCHIAYSVLRTYCVHLPSVDRDVHWTVHPLELIDKRLLHTYTRARDEPERTGCMFVGSARDGSTASSTLLVWLFCCCMTITACSSRGWSSMIYPPTISNVVSLVTMVSVPSIRLIVPVKLIFFLLKERFDPLRQFQWIKRVTLPQLLGFTP